MNYYQARQRKSDMLWHYTCQNDNNIWSVGYCGHECDGHATKEEAEAHYRAYVLDTADYERRLLNTQRRCEVCEAWTDRVALSGVGMAESHVLCDAHCNREGLNQVLPEQREIISSW